MDFAQEKLGYTFVNAALQEEALTTPAYRMDHPNAVDNQRLEFLGDAVLGLLSAEQLYAQHPKEAEGPLTILRTRMVSAAALCVAAGRLGLAAHLRRNRGAQPLSPHAKTLADAVEALIGAAYLDGGLPAARQVFTALELTVSETNDESAWQSNPKGCLQILSQAMRPPRHPAYTLLKRVGKAHEPLFTVRVSVDGVGVAEASAHALKEAESLAASQLLKQMPRDLT